MTEFEKNAYWNFRDKVRIGAQVGMTFFQIDKWNFDMKRKLGIKRKRKYVRKLHEQKIDKKRK